MIVLSMLLVLVGAVTLAIGAFFRDDLTFVWISIASCLLAALFLALGIVRSRPSRRPPLTSGGPGGEASWSGAGTWPRPGGTASTGGTVTEDAAFPEPAPREETGAWSDHERWAPRRDEDALVETLAAVDGVGPAKRQAIAERFGSLEALRNAAVDDIAVVEGVGDTLARRISEHVRT